MDNSQGLAGVQHNQGCPAPQQQHNLMYMVAQHLVPQNTSVTLQAQQLPPGTLALPAQQASTALRQLAAGSILAAAAAGHTSAFAAQGQSTVSTPTGPFLQPSQAAGVMAVPGFAGLHLGLSHVLQPAAHGVQPAAAGAITSGTGMHAALASTAASFGGLQAAAAALAGLQARTAADAQHAVGAQQGRASATAAAGIAAAAQLRAASTAGSLQGAEKQDLTSSTTGSPGVMLQAPSGAVASLQAAAAAQAPLRPQFPAAPPSVPPTVQPAAAVVHGAADGGADTGAAADPSAAAAGDAADLLGRLGSTAGSAAGAAPGPAASAAGGVSATALERCPNDLVAVVCGQLHGWYSTSKDKILLLQQYSGSDLLQEQQQQQQLAQLQPPLAALPSAWVTRSGFVKLAGPKFSQKHSADAAIHVLESDGSRGVTLMALSRRQRRQLDKEHKQQQAAHQQQQRRQHQQQQQRLLQQLQQAAVLQQAAGGVMGGVPSFRPAAAADAGSATPELAFAGTAMPSLAAAAAAAGGAAGPGHMSGQQAQPSSQHVHVAQQQQQRCTVDLSADMAMVVCGPIRGWYSNVKDKVLLQQAQPQLQPLQAGSGEQQQQQQQHGEADGQSAAQGYSDPDSAPEAAWLTREAFMRLAGPTYCKNDCSKAIKVLLPDGSVGTTMSTYLKNRQEHLQAARYAAGATPQQQHLLPQQQEAQRAGSSGRRSGRLQAVRQYDSRRSSTPTTTGAGSDCGTGSGIAALNDTDSACSSPAAAAAAVAAGVVSGAAEAAAVPDAQGGLTVAVAATARSESQGSLVPVVCGTMLGWYCSKRDQVLPQQHQLQQLLGNLQQQVSQQQGEWVSKTAFMKMAAVQFWKCDSNKAIKLVAADGTLGSTLGTFIKHERRRMWEEQQEQQPQPQQQLLQANPDPQQLLQPDAAAILQGFAESNEKRRSGRFCQSVADGGAHTPTASAVTTTEGELTEGREGSVMGPAAAGGGAAAAAGSWKSLPAGSKGSRHRSAAAAAAAAGAEAGALSDDEGVSAHERRAVPVVCGTAYGFYSSSRDEVLLLLKKHQHKGWQQQQILPDPKTLPGSYWVTKLAFKKLGGMQHQHDVLKAIKLLQPDGSLGVTLATFLKHERLQQEQQEGLSPALEGRRRHAAAAPKQQRRNSTSTSSGVNTPEQSPAPPAKKPCRRKANNNGGLGATAKMAAQAAAHRRALARIAALVAAAEAADAAEEDTDMQLDEPAGDGGGGPTAAGEADSANAAAAAEAAVCGGSSPSTTFSGIATSDVSAGTIAAADDAGLTGAEDTEAPAAATEEDAAAAAAAAAVRAEAAAVWESVGWYGAAAAAATPETSEDEAHDVVPVLCGCVRGWYSSSRDMILLHQELHADTGAVTEAPAAAAAADQPGLQEDAQQQQQLAAQLVSVPEACWLTKQAFKKLGGMQHQHDALKAVKLMRPDGSTGITLATHLKHSKLQRQRRKQEQRERRRQELHVRVGAFMAAVEAAAAADGVLGSEGLGLFSTGAAAAGVDAGYSGGSAEVPAAAAPAVGRATSDADAGQVVQQPVACRVPTVDMGGSAQAPASTAGAGVVSSAAAAAAHDALTQAPMAAAGVPPGFGVSSSSGMDCSPVQLAGGGIDAGGSSPAGNDDAFLLAAAAGLMQLHSLAGDATAATAGPEPAHCSTGNEGHAAAAAAAAGTAAPVVVMPWTAPETTPGEPATRAAVAAVPAVAADIGIGHAAKDVDLSPAAAGDAAGAGAAASAAAAADDGAAGVAAAVRVSQADDASDQNPDSNHDDVSRLVNSSKKRASTGVDSGGDDCKKRRLVLSADSTAAAAAAYAADAAEGEGHRLVGVIEGLGVSADAAAGAAADVPLVRSTAGAVLLHQEQQALQPSGRGSSGSSYDLTPL